MELDDFMEIPEFSKAHGRAGPPRLKRHLSMNKLTVLSDRELARRKARHQQTVAYCDTIIDDNMDCSGYVCDNTRYDAGKRRVDATEQLRKIEIVERHR